MKATISSFSNSSSTFSSFLLPNPIQHFCTSLIHPNSNVDSTIYSSSPSCSWFLDLNHFIRSDKNMEAALKNTNSSTSSQTKQNPNIQCDTRKAGQLIPKSGKGGGSSPRDHAKSNLSSANDHHSNPNPNPNPSSNSRTNNYGNHHHQRPNGETGAIKSSSNRSDSLESTSSNQYKPHTGGDIRWDAINSISKGSGLGLNHFRILKRIGYGDIGSVYLVELRGSNAHFAMKVMDKASLVSRNKLQRAQTEREILGLLDHPFLPTLYSYFETDKFYCLVMEFCSGGNLHSLRQKQPNKHFTEEAARFYATEVLLALEYLHMLGIVYRDLKPENVLVRDEGHIMLSDFDLSLRCSVNPTLVKSASVHVNGSSGGGGGSGSGSSGAILDDEYAVQGCMQPSHFLPRMMLPGKKNRKSKSDFGLLVPGGALPELMAEPTNVRSMSFVGTHEYLAPEIIRGEGHGSAVDWWTYGIFLYELLHGTTPFKGNGNRATLYNVVGQPLRFPDSPNVSMVARDLIKGLLVKEPQKRIAYKRGATEIKQHPFFEGVNWALIRSAAPPHVPDPVDFSQFASKDSSAAADKKMTTATPATTTPAPSVNHHKDNGEDNSNYVDFEYF